MSGLLQVESREGLSVLDSTKLNYAGPALNYRIWKRFFPPLKTSSWSGGKRLKKCLRRKTWHATGPSFRSVVSTRPVSKVPFIIYDLYRYFWRRWHLSCQALLRFASALLLNLDQLPFQSCVIACIVSMFKVGFEKKLNWSDLFFCHVWIPFLKRFSIIELFYFQGCNCFNCWLQTKHNLAYLVL